MTRGKHGLQAARRRADSMEDAQRLLTEQYADLKAKAVRWKSDAERLGAAEIRVRQLLDQIKANTSDDVIRLTEQLRVAQEQNETLSSHAAWIQQRYERVLHYAIDLAGGGVEGQEAVMARFGTPAKVAAHTDARHINRIGHGADIERVRRLAARGGRTRGGTS